MKIFFYAYLLLSVNMLATHEIEMSRSKEKVESLSSWVEEKLSKNGKLIAFLVCFKNTSKNGVQIAFIKNIEDSYRYFYEIPGEKIVDYRSMRGVASRAYSKDIYRVPSGEVFKLLLPIASMVKPNVELLPKEKISLNMRILASCRSYDNKGGIIVDSRRWLGKYRIKAKFSMTQSSYEKSKLLNIKNVNIFS